jgi:hypothetical protein
MKLNTYFKIIQLTACHLNVLFNSVVRVKKKVKEQCFYGMRPCSLVEVINDLRERTTSVFRAIDRGSTLLRNGKPLAECASSFVRRQCSS